MEETTKLERQKEELQKQIEETRERLAKSEAKFVATVQGFQNAQLVCLKKKESNLST